jgi:hypothetical protein
MVTVLINFPFCFNSAIPLPAEAHLVWRHDAVRQPALRLFAEGHRRQRAATAGETWHRRVMRNMWLHSWLFSSPFFLFQ